MSKISLTRPSSTGTNLYGSLRKHSTFVSITIRTGNGGDHVMETGTDDTGFKSAHDSKLVRQVPVHRVNPHNGYKELVGWKKLEASELSKEDRCSKIIDVMMSHEQFAELLTSTGHQIDCTIGGLRGFGTPGHHYVEEVKTPPNIRDRMLRRVAKAQEKALAEIDKGIADIDTWTATTKVKDAARRALTMTRQHLMENTAFTVTQAVEEMSVQAEAATTIIADKVSSLEAAGRLPTGSTDRFMKGSNVLGLPQPEISE